MKQKVDYDVLIIDEFGDVGFAECYEGVAHPDAKALDERSKRLAIEHAQRIIKDGRRRRRNWSAVVERVEYTLWDETQGGKTIVWSGGDYDRLAARGWLVAGDSDSEGGAA